MKSSRSPVEATSVACQWPDWETPSPSCEKYYFLFCRSWDLPLPTFATPQGRQSRQAPAFPAAPVFPGAHGHFSIGKIHLLPHQNAPINMIADERPERSPEIQLWVECVETESKKALGRKLRTKHYICYFLFNYSVPEK